jgi:ubiquinone/menaquinone biosynthesis C-methylase UbiE
MNQSIDPQAKMFDECADTYAQYRPTYPDAAVEKILSAFDLNPGKLICDLGAGTGVMSLLIARHGISVIALEPLEMMRKKGAMAAAECGLPVIFAASRAEQIALRDQSVDAVVCAQAFHWFEAESALKEIHRVLKPEGGLALVWNNWNWRRIGWLAKLEQLIMKYNPQHHPSYRAKDWAQIVNGSGLFSPVQTFEYFHDRTVREDELLGLVDSFSYVRVIPIKERIELREEIKALFRRECEQQSGETLVVQYQTELYLTRKQ